MSCMDENIAIGLVGASGTLGSALRNLLPQVKVLNRDPDISVLKSHIDVTFICAPSGLKWYANMYPEQDYHQLQKLIELLNKVDTDRLVLFSTIDTIGSEYGGPNYYGYHRRILEKYVLNDRAGSVIRLGALLAPFINKNFLNDMKKNNVPYLPNSESRFQFSNLFILDAFIEQIISNKFRLFNYFSEPLKVDCFLRELQCVNYEYCVNNNNKIIEYNIKNTNDNIILDSFNKVANSRGACVAGIREYLEG